MCTIRIVMRAVPCCANLVHVRGHALLNSWQWWNLIGVWLAVSRPQALLPSINLPLMRNCLPSDLFPLWCQLVGPRNGLVGADDDEDTPNIDAKLTSRFSTQIKISYEYQITSHFSHNWSTTIVLDYSSTRGCFWITCNERNSCWIM